MRNILFVLLAAFLFASCGKEDSAKLEISNAEAFAYDIGDEWEVNAIAQIKGFSQESKDEKFIAQLSYDIDLVKPSGEIIKSLVSKIADKIDSEKMTDTQLDIQFNLDSTYAQGNYKIIINLKDVESGQEASASAQFKLE